MACGISLVRRTKTITDKMASKVRARMVNREIKIKMERAIKATRAMDGTVAREARKECKDRVETKDRTVRKEKVRVEMEIKDRKAKVDRKVNKDREAMARMETKEIKVTKAMAIKEIRATRAMDGIKEAWETRAAMDKEIIIGEMKEIGGEDLRKCKEGIAKDGTTDGTKITKTIDNRTVKMDSMEGRDSKVNRDTMECKDRVEIGKCHDSSQGRQ
jgi:hypothetical protein